MRLALLILLPLVAHAVIVDRVAVVVGEKVITTSEIELRIRLASFQNQQPPDYSLASRQKAVQELIDEKLVEHEMDLGRYPQLDAEHRKELVDQYKTTNEALASYGLTRQDLEDELARQSDLLSFLNLRFTPAVQVTDQDVQKYIDDNAPGQQAGTEMRAAIAKKLTMERADKELDVWLHDQRKRTRIEYLEKDLEVKQ
jgi:hypothetical protein